MVTDDQTAATRPRLPAHTPLEELATWLTGADASTQVRGATDGVQVSGVSLSSQRILPGDLYAALPGASRHGAEFAAADGPLHRILEGTIIDTILTNRLDGGATAPVNCLVSTPIYSTDQQVLIPAGARVLGRTKPVQSFGETRLAVGFTRVVMPNGRTYSLDHFMGLNAIGDAGLRDQVNQHYASTFGVSAAVGLISGFAQYLGGGFVNRNSGPIIITGNVGDATAQAATQTMSRFLNRLPTITIREGHRVKVYLTSDLQLPVYQVSQSDRGLRLAGRVQP